MKIALVLFLVVTMLVPTMTWAEESSDEYVVTVFYAEWDDSGWNQAHEDGWEFVKAQGTVLEESSMEFLVEFPDGKLLRVHYVTNCGYDAGIETKMRSAIEIQKPDMIYATWWDSKDAVRTLAPEFPDVLFNHCSGFPVLASTQFPETNNVSTFFVRMYYADYQIGKMVGLMGYEQTGAVGTHTIPEPVRGINAYHLGVERGREEAGLGNENTETNAIWIKAWLDREKEQLATEALVAEGYILIKQVADTPTTAQTACELGVDVVGYGRDVSLTAPCALATNGWNWGDYYFKSVRAGMDGVWEPHDYYEIGTKLTFSDKIPQDIQDKVNSIPLDEVWQGPISGYGFDKNGERYDIFVPEGKCLVDDDLLSMQWFVNRVKSSVKIEFGKFRFSVD